MDATAELGEDRLSPSLSCLEDADLLDLLLFQRVQRQFAVSPAQIEQHHSRAIFEELLSKHEGCHEALFGIGRICVLEKRYEEAVVYLQDSVALLNTDPLYLSWLAWALLLLSPSQGLIARASYVSRARDCCHDALQLICDFALALRCLVHIAVSPVSVGGGLPSSLSYAKQLALAHPVTGLGVLGRTLLEDKAQARIGVEGLRMYIAEVPVDSSGAEHMAASIVRRCVQTDASALVDSLGRQCAAASVSTPESTSPALQTHCSQEGPQPCHSHVVSAKLIVLDALWRYFVRSAGTFDQAVEAALLAVAALRHCPSAGQRAVCLALKALALQGRWDECWRLASAELSLQPSREVLYQCGRLAYFDGRREPIDAYLPHLCSLLSVVPAIVRVDVQFWIGMLHHKRGHGILAVRSLQAAIPLLQASGSPAHLSKMSRAEKLVADVEHVEDEVLKVYDFTNTIWKAAAQRHHAVQQRTRPVPDDGLSPSYTQDRPLAATPQLGGIGYPNPSAAPPTSDRAVEAWSAHTASDEHSELGFDDDFGSEIGGNRGAGSEISQGSLASSRPSGSVHSGSLLWRHTTVMSEMQSSLYGAPWKILGTWRGSQAVMAVEALDRYLGMLCRGRLAVVRADVGGAEKAWRAAALEFPLRLEPYIELWRLHSSQRAHKKAVLDIRRAVELATTASSEWGKYVGVNVDILLDGKVWPGADASLDVDHVVHLLLGKSLRLCKLWEQAWQSLCTGRNDPTITQAALGAFSYQIGKVCVQYLEEFLAMQCRARRGRSSSSLARHGSAAPPTPLDKPEPSMVTFDDATLRLWLSRGRDHLEEFRRREMTEADCQKGATYRGRLEHCADLLEQFSQQAQGRTTSELVAYSSQR